MLKDDLLVEVRLRSFSSRRSATREQVWKLSDMDLQSYQRWFDYSQARDDMRCYRYRLGPLVGRHLRWQEEPRLNVISHVLSGIPYEHLEHAMSNYRIVRIRATTGNRTPRCTTFQRPI